MYSDRVLLTIHGVTSDNSGFAKLRAECERELPGLVVETCYYGNVTPFKDLSANVQQTVFTTIRLQLENTWLKHVKSTERKLYVVAHSFGTLCVIRALEMHIPDLKIEALVLFGSIIPREQYWDGWMKGSPLAAEPLAVIRPMDWVVRWGKKMGGADSGASGFVANGTHIVRQTYKDGGHTAYYPHDVNDVIAVIRAGVQSVPVTSLEDWQRTCGWRQAPSVWIGKAFRMFNR